MYTLLAEQLKTYARTLGIASMHVAACQLPTEREALLNTWLEQQLNTKPADWVYYDHLAHRQKIVAQAKSIILISLPYWHEPFNQSWRIINNSEKAYISRVALGKNPNTVLSEKLAAMTQYIAKTEPEAFIYELSITAPVSAIILAELSGLGWRGKNALLLQKNTGSMFVMGMLLTSIPLPPDKADIDRCGDCDLCQQVCPGGALEIPYQVNQQKCVSYWTRVTPELTEIAMRKAIGNKIYGCDNCQLICPINRNASTQADKAFCTNDKLDNIELRTLLLWTEADFNQKMVNSSVLRIGYYKWLSNIIIALGNAPPNDENINALQPFLSHHHPMIRETAQWAVLELSKQSKNNKN